jgi:hypothetical protein
MNDTTIMSTVEGRLSFGRHLAELLQARIDEKSELTKTHVDGGASLEVVREISLVAMRNCKDLNELTNKILEDSLVSNLLSQEKSSEYSKRSPIMVELADNAYRLKLGFKFLERVQ